MSTQGVVVGKVGYSGASVTTQTEKFTLTPAQIRTLNTVPVNAVVPETEHHVVVPLDCMVVGEEGAATYSAPPGLELQYEGLSPQVVVEGSLWDGSTPVVDYTPNILTANQPRDALPYVGIPLQFTSPADVTGGDADYIVFLTYRVYDLTGFV